MNLPANDQTDWPLWWVSTYVRSNNKWPTTTTCLWTFPRAPTKCALMPLSFGSTKFYRCQTTTTTYIGHNILRCCGAVRCVVNTLLSTVVIADASVDAATTFTTTTWWESDGIVVGLGHAMVISPVDGFWSSYRRTYQCKSIPSHGSHRYLSRSKTMETATRQVDDIVAIEAAGAVHFGYEAMVALARSPLTLVWHSLRS